MTDLIDILQEVYRALVVLSDDSGWHAPPHETWAHADGIPGGELVASQRVVSTDRGGQLQVMTYSGNVYAASPNVVLTTVGTHLR